MKKKRSGEKGMTVIEVVISMCLFLLVIIPVTDLNTQLLSINRQLDIVAEEEKFFQNIVTYLSSNDYQFLSKYKGESKYTVSEIEGRAILIPTNPLVEKIVTMSNMHNGKQVLININDVDIISYNKNDKIISLSVSFYGKTKTYASERIVSKFEKFIWE